MGVDVYKEHFSNFKITHIIFFSLLVLSWILLIVTFSGTTYWYKYQDEGIKVHWRFSEVRLDIGTDNKYIAQYSKYGDNESNIFKACISFTILSFVVVNVILILVVIQILIKSNTRFIDYQILKKSIRFIPIIAFTFSLLSILIALGFNKAYEKDCKLSTTCYQSIFDGGFYGSKGTKSWGPDVGWITSLIATIFLFLASILSIFNNRTIIKSDNNNNNNNNNFKMNDHHIHHNNNGADSVNNTP